MLVVLSLGGAEQARLWSSDRTCLETVGVGRLTAPQLFFLLGNNWPGIKCFHCSGPRAYPRRQQESWGNWHAVPYLCVLVRAWPWGGGGVALRCLLPADGAGVGKALHTCFPQTWG